MLNLESISNDNDYISDVRNKAIGFRGILSNPRFFITLLFMLDILKVLKDTSLMCEETSSTLIGMHCILGKLVINSQHLQSENGEFLNDIIKKAQCYNGSHWLPCKNSDLDNCNFRMTLQRTEVHFHSDSIRSAHSQWPILSIFRKDITEALISQIQLYFPEGSLEIFNVLNPVVLPTTVEDAVVYSAQIIPLSQRFFKSHKEVHQEFLDLLTFFLNQIHDEYCSYKSKEAHIFWPHFLHHNLVPWKPKIKHLITTVLVLPVGTADVERSFSILNHFKYNRRSTLTTNHVQDITRIRYNGPDIRNFDAFKYALHWYTSGKKKTKDTKDAKGDNNDEHNVHHSILF